MARMVVLSVLACFCHLWIAAAASAQGSPLPDEAGLVVIGSEARAALAGAEVRGGRATLEEVEGDLVLRVDAGADALPWGPTVLFSGAERDVPKGGGVLGSLAIRTRGAAEPATTRVFLVGEGKAPLAMRQVALTSAWQTVRVAAPADGGVRADRLRLIVALDGRDREVEIADVQVRLVGEGERLEADATGASTADYPGRAADAPWRDAAAKRIDEHRKSDLVVQVLDATGEPVPGATVRVEQVRHAFRFGTAVTTRGLFLDPSDNWWERREIAMDARSQERYREAVLANFNSYVFANAFKSPAWEGDWGSAFDHERVREAMDWFESHGFAARGHPLVYSGWGRQSKRIKKLHEAGDLEAARQAIREQVREKATFGRGEIDAWDVANEVHGNEAFYEDLGWDELATYFRLGDEYAPDAAMYLNDNGVLDGRGRTHNDKRRWYRQIIQDLQTRGAPIDGIGFQAHYKGRSVTPPEELYAVLDWFAQTGLELEVTEFDFPIDESTPEHEALQADYLRDFYTVLFSHPSVAGVTMWGFWDGDHWKPSAGMYRNDWSPRPALAAYRQLVFGDWWTDAQLTSGEAGEASVRAFHGTHRVTVEHDGRTAEQVIQLGPESGRVVVQLD